MLLEKGDREDRWVCLLITMMTALEGTRGLFYLYAAKLWGPGDRKISRKLVSPIKHLKHFSTV